MPKLIPTALAMLCTLAQLAALAQDAWPSKPIRIVVPAAAGLGVDLTARRLTDKLARHLSQPLVVDNRPGAGGAIAADNVARSPADGHTFLVATSAPLVLNTFLTKNLRYDPARDFAAIGKIIESPFVIVVHKNAPFNSVAGLIAYDKAHPGKLSFASDGIKNLSGLTGEMFNRMAGTKMVQIPYSATGRAVTDTIAGQTQLTFLSPNTTQEAVKNGDLRMIGVTTRRVQFLGDLPAISETVPGFEVSGWMMLVAPRDTPKSIIDRMNAAMALVLREPEWVQEQLRATGYLVKEPGVPAELDDFLVKERVKWGGLIKALGIDPE